MTKPETPSQAQREAEILHPTRTVHLANGSELAVREFTWGEALRMGSRVRPLADAVAENVSADNLVLGQLWAAMEDHPDLFFHLVGQACCVVSRGQEPLAEPEQCDAAWAEALCETDGERVAAAFWAVNADFFGRSVKRAWERRLASLRGAGAEQALANLSPDSSAWDTAKPI